MSIVLGKDENVIREDVFTTNLALFWLKSNFSLTNKRVTGQSPNTLFGLIPLGKHDIAQPLKNITSIACSTKFYIGRLVLGLFLIFIGIAIQNIYSLIILILPGLILLLNSYTTTMQIASNNVSAQTFEISILEKAKVESFVTQMNTTVSEL